MANLLRSLHCSLQWMKNCCNGQILFCIILSLHHNLDLSSFTHHIPLILLRYTPRSALFCFMIMIVIYGIFFVFQIVRFDKLYFEHNSFIHYNSDLASFAHHIPLILFKMRSYLYFMIVIYEILFVFSILINFRFNKAH